MYLNQYISNFSDCQADISLLTYIRVILMEKRIVLALDKALEERGITRYELAKRANTYFHTIDNYYKNKVVRYDSDLLLRICVALDCDIGDIIKII